MKTLKPTYANQLKMAWQLVNDKGLDAVYNPHALTGKKCKCGDCFCCAALEVYNAAKSPSFDHTGIRMEENTR